MIKAIIFDCFGVLATDHWRAFCEEYIAPIPGALDEVWALNRDVDAGRITYSDFIRRVAIRTGLDEAHIHQGMQVGDVNTELLEYIKTQVAPHYRTGLLSNAPDYWLDKILTPAQVAMFDDITLSYAVGMTKPSPEIYTLAAERLGVRPEECLFVDDQPRNCDGAAQVGMHPLLYTTMPAFQVSFSALVE